MTSSTLLADPPSNETIDVFYINNLLFLSWDWEAWCLTQSGGRGGNAPHPERNTAWNKGRKCFHCLGAPNNWLQQKLSGCHRTLSLINALKTIRWWNLTWARLIQSTHCHLICWIHCDFILPGLPRSCMRSTSFSFFPTKDAYTFPPTLFGFCEVNRRQSRPKYQFLKLLNRLLTLRLLTSYIYGAPSKARNANVVYIWTYVWQRWNSLFLFAAQCLNTESMQRGFLCHICV